MKKIIGMLLLVLACSVHAQQGSVCLFVEKQNTQLTTPIKKAFISAAGLVAATATASALAFETTKKPDTRSVTTDVISPLIWIMLGSGAAAFLGNYLIGNEIRIILATRKNLKALEKQITIWQETLPKLQQNQDDLALKIQKAVKTLNTIVPLVVKLSKDPDTSTIDQITTIKADIQDLKKNLEALAANPCAQLAQQVEKKSHSLFGFGKK